MLVGLQPDCVGRNIVSEHGGRRIEDETRATQLAVKALVIEFDRRAAVERDALLAAASASHPADLKQIEKVAGEKKRESQLDALLTEIAHPETLMRGSIPEEEVRIDALRSQGAEVQPHGRRARAPVEREHERPLDRRAAPVERVRDVEDVRLELSRLVPEGHEARRGRVLEDFSADAKLVMRHDRRLLLLFLLCLGRLRFRGRGLLGSGGLGSGRAPGASGLRLGEKSDQREDCGRRHRRPPRRVFDRGERVPYIARR